MSVTLPSPRSQGALTKRRIQQPWPSGRDFKILSIDGGGIKGIFPAVVLAELEERFLSGRPIASAFDLVAGTSTGGIIALALSIGVSARDIANLYVERGKEIFPPPRHRLDALWKKMRDFVQFRYDRAALTRLLQEVFGERRFGEARIRLCIPACDGRFGDVYVFKTPHHPDFKKDQYELMTTVAGATAAAPTFFQPLDSGGFRFLDGGLWANNPIMVGIVDVLSDFDIDRHRVRVLSLGCGDESYTVPNRVARWGGKLFWANIINGALAFQSQNALGQAALLLGAERVMRIVPRQAKQPIRLDDWVSAKELLPREAVAAVEINGAGIRETFLSV